MMLGRVWHRHQVLLSYAGAVTVLSVLAAALQRVLG